MRNYRKRGRILIELLITLIISSLLLPIQYTAFSTLLNVNLDIDEIQDEIGLVQLRRVMNMCYEKEVYTHSIACTYNNEKVHLSSNDRFLFIKPGTWIFLSGVKEVSFYKENNFVYIEYKRKNRDRTALLAYE